MLADAELRRAIQTVPLVERAGPWVRAIDARYLTAAPPGAPPGSPPQPLWGGGARLHGGRFTPKGSFDTLYLASDLVTAGLEIGAVFGPVGAVSATKDPFTVVTVNGSLTAVLDLTDEAVRETLQTTLPELTGPWRIARDRPTHRLARAAFEGERVGAIAAPSAKHAAAGVVTAIFVERLAEFPPSYVEAIDSSGHFAQRLP